MERYTKTVRKVVSYDLVLLSLLLEDLYQPDIETQKKHCPMHPLRKKICYSGGFFGYLADMNVMLAYWNLQDRCRDAQTQAGKPYAFLSSPFAAACARNEEKSRVMQNRMQALWALQQRREPSLQQAANVFGVMVGEVFAVKDDAYAPSLRQLGEALGRFIYLCDAALDLKEDQKKGQYNPFLFLERVPDQALIEDILGIMAQDVWAWYVSLRKEAHENAGIIQNILTKGLFVRYNTKRKQRRTV